jgi:hypothetical protein
MDAYTRLSVSGNGRFLVYADGEPFFYLGDTAWELFHRLSREDAELYLRNRASKGFTVVQAVALAELEGLKDPNVYGDLPLHDLDPTRPNEAYFRHVDWVIEKAASLGLFVGLLPTWGDKVNPKWGVGPVVFTPENARIYGEWLGRRYKGTPNILWINGGDRNPESPEHFAIFRALAEGLRAGDGGRHLITYHPMGGSGSAALFHNEDWLDFNMRQSGHHARDIDNGAQITSDYVREPVKPCLDGEPCYEDHPVNWEPDTKGWFDEYDARKAAYRAVFAGACGHTYGAHSIWQFLDKDLHPAVGHARTPWRDAIDLPGSAQMMHLRALIELRPSLSRIPDQSVVRSPEPSGATGPWATRAEDGSFAFVYLPEGQAVTLNTGTLQGNPGINYTWYDPRTGATRAATFSENAQFVPPTSGTGCDWVLVLDAQNSAS